MTAVWLRWWAELKRQAANATPMQILGVVTVVLINVAVFGLLAYIGGDQVLHCTYHSTHGKTLPA